MHEAKTHLSRLVELALAGEEIVIARRTRPLIRLEVIPQPGSRRCVGALKGLLQGMGDDFNDSLEDWDPSWPAGADVPGKPR
jgi:antitoxin (DNA-binding transcriptional repressor) of toxin-antitoxin stability system